MIKEETTKPGDKEEEVERKEGGGRVNREENIGVNVSGSDAEEILSSNQESQPIEDLLANEKEEKKQQTRQSSGSGTTIQDLILASEGLPIFPVSTNC